MDSFPWTTREFGYRQGNDSKGDGLYQGLCTFASSTATCSCKGAQETEAASTTFHGKPTGRTTISVHRRHRHNCDAPQPPPAAAPSQIPQPPSRTPQPPAHPPPPAAASAPPATSSLPTSPSNSRIASAPGPVNELSGLSHLLRGKMVDRRTRISKTNWSSF